MLYNIVTTSRGKFSPRVGTWAAETGIHAIFNVQGFLWLSDMESYIPIALKNNHYHVVVCILDTCVVENECIPNDYLRPCFISACRNNAPDVVIQLSQHPHFHNICTIDLLKQCIANLHERPIECDDFIFLYLLGEVAARSITLAELGCCTHSIHGSAEIPLIECLLFQTGALISACVKHPPYIKEIEAYKSLLLGTQDRILDVLINTSVINNAADALGVYGICSRTFNISERHSEHRIQQRNICVQIRRCNSGKLTIKLSPCIFKSRW